MVNMTETGILPACAKDLQKCSTASNKFATPRKVAYEEVVDRLFGLIDVLRTDDNGCPCVVFVFLCVFNTLHSEGSRFDLLGA